MIDSLIAKYVGNIHITSSITLTNVLFLPQLSFNLISIHKLCSDIGRHLIFHHNHGEIQETRSMRMIGLSKAI